MTGALAAGQICLDVGADRDEVAAALVRLPGIGSWTAAYVAMRALGDPDAFLPTDLGVRRALARLGVAADPVSAAALAERWRPWRSYALQYLWATLDAPADSTKDATKDATKDSTKDATKDVTKDSTKMEKTSA